MQPPTNQCRNCGAREFYVKEVAIGGYLQSLVPVGFFAHADVQLRVCGHCGLMDWFITPESLAKVKAKFPREPDAV